MRMRVLLADDSQPMRLMLRALLALEPDFEVVGEAVDGVEAVALAEREDADLLVLDLALPGLDGLEVLERIRAFPERPRIVIYSGHAAPDSESAVRALGAVDFILKGVAPEELVRRLRAAAQP
jgi:DNA-binding NarL/FixJ family response regulator